jgi:chemotaxis signal transduction protein
MTAENSFEGKIAAATSAAEISEICKQQGERIGFLVRERDGSVNIRDTFVQQPPAPQPETQSDSLLRRAVRLENGTVRLIEAYSVGGLDILEGALRKGQI